MQHNADRKLIAVPMVTFARRHERNAVDSGMNDNAECGQHQDEPVRLRNRIVESVFEQYRESEAQQQEQDRQVSARADRFGNDMDENDPGNRDEHDPVEELPQRGTCAAEFVNDRPEQQGKDAQDQHRQSGFRDIVRWVVTARPALERSRG